MRAVSKYRAQRTTVDNITFASQKEARRYRELKLLERAGDIRGLTMQPEFPLYVAVSGGDPERIGVYRGDFAYEERVVRGLKITKPPTLSIAWEDVVEDVKGFKTPLYRWKKKHVEAQYGIQIRET